MSMKKDDNSICGNCAYSVEAILPGQITKVLQCRRYPPSMFPTQQGFMTIHPIVQPGDRCGEFEVEKPGLSLVS